MSSRKRGRLAHNLICRLIGEYLLFMTSELGRNFFNLRHCFFIKIYHQTLEEENVSKKR